MRFKALECNIAILTDIINDYIEEYASRKTIVYHLEPVASDWRHDWQKKFIKICDGLKTVSDILLNPSSDGVSINPNYDLVRHFEKQFKKELLEKIESFFSKTSLNHVLDHAEATFVIYDLLEAFLSLSIKIFGHNDVYNSFQFRRIIYQNNSNIMIQKGYWPSWRNKNNSITRSEAMYAIKSIPFPFDKYCGSSYWDKSEYRYHVALSFAGEDRHVAKEIADKLIENGLDVFYDKYEEAELWGKDLYEHLTTIYTKTSQYCLILISKNYEGKLWTTHERKSAQTRAFTEESEYILPIKLDDTEIPFIPVTIGYIDYRNSNAEYIANLVTEKLKNG